MKVSKQSKVMLLAAGLALLAPSAMKAQDDGRAAARAVEYAQSRQIVADLQAIESDRATAESTLISRWEAVMDPNAYDVRREIGSIASRAPAWQLYAASKAQDFSTMVRVLRGQEYASAYIDGPKEADSPQVLGSTTDQLVYTPISPCRIVDTRGTGARTGILPAGSARTFDLTSDGFFDGQGGAVSCTGLPSYSYVGWAVNVTVTGYGAGNGWLTIWPYLGVEPVASQVNYAAGVWSTANGLNLTGCDGCLDDITIRANAAGTHVIIDVFGYFQNAVVGQAVISRLAGASTVVVNNSGAFVSGAACPAGTRLIGGDVDHGAFDVAIGEYTGVAQTYIAWMINRNGANAAVTAYSRCLTTPIYVP